MLGYSTEYEDELSRLAKIYDEGDYDYFKQEYYKFMDELEKQPQFARYKKILQETYNL